MVLPGSGVPNRVPAERVWSLVDKCDAVGYQPFVGLGALVSKRADYFFIVVPVVREPVGFYDRPIRQVRVQKVRRVHDAVFLLPGCPATQSYVSAAQYR